MNIHELLHRYFEGETTTSEEKELRELFTKGIVPPELEEYRAFFGYFEQQKQTGKNILFRKRPWGKYVYTSIAVSLLLIVGIGLSQKYNNQKFDNYVMIDGKRYSDISLIRQEAQQAFEEVSFTQEEIFDSLFE